MRYRDFKEAIHGKLLAEGGGLTWQRLRDDLNLPYERPCPAWTRCLEQEIGLIRRKGAGRSLIWTIDARART